MRVKSIQELPVAMRTQAERQVAGLSRSPTVGVPIALQGHPGKTKTNKFGAIKVECNGITFDSKWERDRYEELLLMERAGLIEDLSVHKSFALHCPVPDGPPERVVGWEADFVYWRNGTMTVEDAKSPATRRTKDYIIKRKWFETEWRTRVVEVERNKPRFGVES